MSAAGCYGVREFQADSGTRDGVTTAEKERVKALEREVKELRQANEILRLASALSTNTAKPLGSSQSAKSLRLPRLDIGNTLLANAIQCCEVPGPLPMNNVLSKYKLFGIRTRGSTMPTTACTKPK